MIELFLTQQQRLSMYCVSVQYNINIISYNSNCTLSIISFNRLVFLTTMIYVVFFVFETKCRSQSVSLGLSLLNCNLGFYKNQPKAVDLIIALLVLISVIVCLKDSISIFMS